MKGTLESVATSMPSAPYMDSITGKPTNTVFENAMAKAAMPRLSVLARMSFAVSRPRAAEINTSAKNAAKSRPTSASDSSMSAEVTESSIVNTSRTFSTTFEPERVNSGPVTPIFVQKKPTAIIKTSIPIWVNTGVISICNHLSQLFLNKNRAPTSYRAGAHKLINPYICSIAVARPK